MYSIINIRQRVFYSYYTQIRNVVPNYCANSNLIKDTGVLKCDRVIFFNHKGHKGTLKEHYEYK